MRSVAVVLAAGLGTRMKSRLPKVLHPVLGDPCLLWVLRSLPEEIPLAFVVVHHGKDRVMESLAAWESAGLLPCPVRTVHQDSPRGTGHALQACIPHLDGCGAESVLILSGDVPLLPRERLESLVGHPSALLAADLDDPGDYGRVLQREDGSLLRIVESRDAEENTRAVRRVNGGSYHLPWVQLREALQGLGSANAQSEYYLTDAVAAVAETSPVKVLLASPEELAGMNSRKDQASLIALAAARINGRWMEEGVGILDPAHTWIGPRAELSPDVVLEPLARVEGSSCVGAGTRIGQASVIRDSAIGEQSDIRPFSLLEKAEVGDRCSVGPFARLREGTRMEDGSQVGNFVETKKAHLKQGVKANHLSYLGDCEIGDRSNIGAGVITCNYDGFLKHRTAIGKDVFVGSDTQFVAPVTVGDGAVIGAGTTVTQDVPREALALTRAPLTCKEGGATRLRARLKSRMG